MNEQDYKFIQQFIKDKAAIIIDAGKDYLIESRLTPVTKEAGLQSIEELVALMRKSPSDRLAHKVIDAMTTNETLFFRDMHPFELLKTKIIPELLISRAAQKKLVIWSAASSSGQEPYTIAMIFKEMQAQMPQLALWDISIIASDLSEKILAKAQEGVYSQLEVNRGLPLNFLVKYFEKRETQWCIKDDIKRMVKFQKVNLMHPWPIKYADVIFLRNVLIYFDVETKKDIFKRLERVIARDGYLFIGGSETVLGLNSGFERVGVDRVPCYKLKN